MTDIYVPDLAGTVTLADLRSAVNRKLRNFLFWMDYTDSGDGTRRAFSLPASNIVEGSLTVTVDGVAATVGSADYDWGTGYLSTVPAQDSAVRYRYQCRLWDDDDVKDALNAGIRRFASRFAMEDTDSTIAVDGTSFEYAVPDTVGYISRIDILGTGATQYLKMHNGWETFTTAGTKYVRFFVPPASNSTLRLVHFRKPGFLSDAEDTLEASGHVLPESRDAVVFWACSVLLLDVVGARVSDANYTTTDSTNTIRLLDIQRASDAFASRAEMAADAYRTPSLTRA